MRFTRTILLTLLIGLTPALSQAVTFYETGDPAHNTTAPTGALTNSGWQLQGTWRACLGTPIGQDHFIAAAHVGGNVGDVFTFHGVQHTTVARYLDSASDLAIWQVTPPFRAWAQLYTGNNEVGKRFVVFGRGTKRGPAVQVEGPLGSVTNGWLWGDYDGVMRWGENTIEEAIGTGGNPHSVIISGAVLTGPLLRATFDPPGSPNNGPNEAALSLGDSGGGIFINDAGDWKLTGLNYAVDGPYNTTSTGPGFFGCIFDEGDLYKGGDGKWVLTADLPTAQGGAFYATRISARLDWIRGIIGDPGLPPATPILEYTTALNTTFVEDTVATFDDANLLFRTPAATQQRFFRIRAAQSIVITGLSREGSDLVLTCRYQ
jgi:hypothetical protein